MTIKTILVEIEEGAINALKEAGAVLKTFAVSDTQQAVAKLKSLPIAVTGMNIISALEAHDGSGASKQTILVGALEAGLEEVKDQDGLAGVVAPIIDIARELGQSLYNDFRSVALGAAGRALPTSTAQAAGGATAH